MEWNCYPEEKPDEDCVCYVFHARLGYAYVATYYAGHDIFRYQHAPVQDIIPMEVTHWVRLPEGPSLD